MNQANRGDDPPATERSVAETLRAIHEGACAPEQLDTPDRQALVGHLTAEGWSVARTAQLLRVADRTIHRDRARIRRAHAVERSPQVVAESIGRLIQEADTSLQHLRQIGRDPAAEPRDRIEAERSAFHIVERLTSRLQSLGILPTATQKLEADLTHRPGAPPEAAQLREQITLLQQHADDPQTTHQLKQLEAQLDRAEAAERLATLTPSTDEDQEHADA